MPTDHTQRDRFDVAIVGAGIVGLAHAYVAARKGLSVVVLERDLRATGASVRNFGTIWPIGQPAGEMHQLALRSRAIWLDVLSSADIAYRPTGSLHVMYRDDEAEVAREFAELAPTLGYDCRWLEAAAAAEQSQAIVRHGLLGALWSPAELSVDPREIAQRLPTYLANRYGVDIRYGCAVTAIDLPTICAGGRDVEADAAIVCSGDDLETLYPRSFGSLDITRCKLQMLRTPAQPDDWQLGPSLAGGL